MSKSKLEQYVRKQALQHLNNIKFSDTHIAIIDELSRANIAPEILARVGRQIEKTCDGYRYEIDHAKKCIQLLDDEN